MVAATPDGRRAFVANIGSGSVTAIDLVAGKVLSSIPTGAGAEGIDVSPDGTKVFVTNRAADTVSVLDVGSLKVVATIESKAFPIRAKVTPDGKWVLVSNAKSGDLSLLSVAAQKVERRITLPAAAVGRDDIKRIFPDFGESSVPVGVLIEPGGGRAFVAHANGDVISVVDLRTFERTATWTAGKEPDGMGYSKLDVKKAAER
jgi:YVTN family beta-propeller protein